VNTRKRKEAAGAALVLGTWKVLEPCGEEEEVRVGTMCFASVFVLIQSEAGYSMRKIGGGRRVWDKG
jgi:hypothetical protein